MKKIAFAAATLLVLFLVLAFTTLQGWNIKEDFSIKFSGKDAGGIFKKFRGDIYFDESNVAASKFSVSIDVASINTGNGLQNKHAKSADWLDAEKYPEIKFTSSKVEKSGSSYRVSGTLEMHGVKKDLAFPFTFSRQGGEGNFQATFSVNRNDFNIGKADDKTASIFKLEVAVPVTKK